VANDGLKSSPTPARTNKRARDLSSDASSPTRPTGRRLSELDLPRSSPPAPFSDTDESLDPREGENEVEDLDDDPDEEEDLFAEGMEK